MLLNRRRILSFAAIAAMLVCLADAYLPAAIAQTSVALDDPYIDAAHRAGVSVELVVAIAGAESGYHPWALDIDGRQVYCRSRDEAEQTLAGLDDDANVDVGLMQINLRFWRHRLKVSKFDLLDPRTNLMYGARILKEGLGRNGSIWRRISNYHAGSADERDRYNQQVYSIYLQYMRGELR